MLRRMRRTAICPKCDFREILLVDTVPDTGEFATEIRQLYVAMVPKRGSFSDGEQMGVAGKLEAAVCRGCGFVEFYVEHPASIPTDSRHVRIVTAPAPQGPHR